MAAAGFVEGSPSLAERALGLLFPSFCMECGRGVGDIRLGALCAACWRAQAWLEGPALARFEGAFRRALLAWKFRRRFSFLRPFSAQLAASAAGLGAAGVAWIPASRASLAERGYDHVGELAARVAARLGLPLLKALFRAREGARQRGLKRPQRLANARGAFRAAIPAPLAGSALLLIDDVRSTGATLADAERALLGAGAGRVHPRVLASAGLHG